MSDTREKINDELVSLCEKVAEIANTDVVYLDAKTTLYDAISELLDRAAVAVLIESDDIISLTEAANMLGVSRQRVHILLQNGQLDGYKVGNTWNVYRASVERRMEQNAL